MGDGDNIVKITPGGEKSTFASGLGGSFGLAFDAAGILFVASQAYGTIIKYTPDGQHTIFASGLGNPQGLAFQGNVAVVPEPSSIVLLAFGIIALLFFVRRRKADEQNDLCIAHPNPI